MNRTLMNKMLLSGGLAVSMAFAAAAQTAPATSPNTTPGGTAPTTTTAPNTGAPNTAAPRAATPNSAAPATTGSTTAPNAAAGLRMADSATMALRFITVSPADFMSSRLMGANVYNNQNESLGEIEDLVIENGRTVKGVVVGVGGFLGLGESYVVLDPATVVLSQRDGTWRAYVDTNRDSLQNAPKFAYTKMRR